MKQIFKFKKTSILFLGCFLLITFLSAFTVYYTSGCANHSGSPADGFACNRCHYGGAVSPSVTIISNPAFSAGNLYIPDQTYTLSVVGMGYSYYGFDLEILNSNSSVTNSVSDFGTMDNATSDEFINLPSGNIPYSDIMHTTPKMGAFTFTWKAPAAGIGYLYCALLGVNNNGATSGDSYCETSFTLTPNLNAGIKEHNINPFNLQTYPNPCSDFINISYTLTQDEHVKMEFVNDLGIHQISIYNENQEKGNHTLHYNLPKTLIKGKLYLKATIGSQIISKIILLQ
jgi:hypothetical protein